MSKSKRPSLTSLVAFAMLMPLLYVLSYAPIVRLCEPTGGFDPDLDIPYPSGTHVILIPEPDFMPMADGSRFPPYKPVDWLIDNTPLNRPLFLWAEIWGVRDSFEMASARRMIELGARWER